jgi:cell division protein FtsZ
MVLQNYLERGDFDELKPSPILVAMSDSAHDRVADLIAAITTLVTGKPNLVGFDFADLRKGLIDGGRAVFGQGEASGPERTIRAADAAIAEIKEQLRRR